jgi:hypothetical protein
MKKLKYFSSIEFAKPIASSSECVPDWYKKIPAFAGGKPVIANNTKPNITVKNCIPFLDALTTGYMLTTWQDIQVVQDNGKAHITWLLQPEPLIMRNKSINQPLPTPTGYEDTHFSWLSPVSYKTPKGISMIITHPLNRFDLPFITLSGLVDADKGMAGGQFPFFIKEGFEGFIPKGTPYAQVLPFKRESWKSQENKDLYEKGKTLTMNCSASKGFYRKNIWHKKDYK